MKKILWAVLMLAYLVPASAMDDTGWVDYMGDLDDFDFSSPSLSPMNGTDGLPDEEQPPLEPLKPSEPLKFIVDPRTKVVRDADGSRLIQDLKASLDKMKEKYQNLAATLLTQARAMENQVEPHKLGDALLKSIRDAMRSSSDVAAVCEKHSKIYRNKLLENSAEIQQKLKKLGAYEDLLQKVFHVIYRSFDNAHLVERCRKNYCWGLADISLLTQGNFEDLKRFDFFCEDGDTEEPIIGTSCMTLKIKGNVPFGICQELDKIFHAQLELANKLPGINKGIRDRLELIPSVAAGKERSLKPDQLPVLEDIKKTAQTQDRERIIATLDQQIEGLMKEVDSIIMELELAYKMALIIEAFQKEGFWHRSQLKLTEKLFGIQKSILDRIICRIHVGGREHALDSNQRSLLQGIKNLEEGADKGVILDQQVEERRKAVEGIVAELEPTYKMACDVEDFLKDVSQHQDQLALAKKLPDLQKGISDRIKLIRQMRAGTSENDLGVEQFLLLEDITGTEKAANQDQIIPILDQKIMELMEEEAAPIIAGLNPTYKIAYRVKDFVDDFTWYQDEKKQGRNLLRTGPSEKRESSLLQQEVLWFQVTKAGDGQSLEIQDAPGGYLMQKLAVSQKELEQAYEAELQEKGKLALGTLEKTATRWLGKKLCQDIDALTEEKNLLKDCCQMKLQKILRMVYDPGLALGKKREHWLVPDFTELTKYFSNLSNLSYVSADINDASKFYIGLYVNNMSDEMLKSLDRFFKTQPFIDELAEIQKNIFKRSEIVYLIATDGALNPEQRLILSSIGPFNSKEAAIDALDQAVDKLFQDTQPLLRKLAPRFWMAEAILKFKKEAGVHKSGRAAQILAASPNRAPPPEEKPKSTASLFSKLRQTEEVDSWVQRGKGFFDSTIKAFSPQGKTKSPSQVQAKSPSQVQAKSPSQVQASSPSQVQASSPSQIQARSSTQTKREASSLRRELGSDSGDVSLDEIDLNPSNPNDPDMDGWQVIENQGSRSGLPPLNLPPVDVKKK